MSPIVRSCLCMWEKKLRQIGIDSKKMWAFKFGYNPILFFIRNIYNRWCGRAVNQTMYAINRMSQCVTKLLLNYHIQIRMDFNLQNLLNQKQFFIDMTVIVGLYFSRKKIFIFYILKFQLVGILLIRSVMLNRYYHWKNNILGQCEGMCHPMWKWVMIQYKSWATCHLVNLYKLMDVIVDIPASV